MNADVIVRNGTFMLDVMQNDPNAVGILINCRHNDKDPDVHTDYFAIKPEALSNGAFLDTDKLSAEQSFVKDIKDTILLEGNIDG